MERGKSRGAGSEHCQGWWKQVVVGVRGRGWRRGSGLCWMGKAKVGARKMEREEDGEKMTTSRNIYHPFSRSSPATSLLPRTTPLLSPSSPPPSPLSAGVPWQHFLLIRLASSLMGIKTCGAVQSISATAGGECPGEPWGPLSPSKTNPTPPLPHFLSSKKKKMCQASER